MNHSDLIEGTVDQWICALAVMCLKLKCFEIKMRLKRNLPILGADLRRI